MFVFKTQKIPDKSPARFLNKRKGGKLYQAANKQINKQSNQQTNKQTNQQANTSKRKKTKKQNETHTHTHKTNNKQTNIHKQTKAKPVDLSSSDQSDDAVSKPHVVKSY